jgi:hypothetical protein
VYSTLSAGGSWRGTPLGLGHRATALGLALLAAAAVTGGWAAPAAAAEVVRIVVSDPVTLEVLPPPRPDGTLPPSLGQVLAEAAAASNLQLEVIGGIPFRRSLRDTGTASDARCLPYLVWTPERATLLRFTRPFLPAEKAVILHRLDNAAFARHARFDDVLADHSLTLSKRDGLFYGVDVETRLERLGTPIRTFGSQDVGACTLVARGRADYCMSTAQAFADMRRDDPATYGVLTMATLADAPVTDAIRIACNRATPDRFLTALDRILSALGQPPAP